MQHICTGHFFLPFLSHFSRLFVTLPSEMANLLRLTKKKNNFFCPALDFS